MKPYEFFEHTADIGVRVHGRTLEELFINAAAAFYEAQGRFTLSSRATRRVEVEAPSTDELLVRWLAELLYLLSAEGACFDRFKIEFTGGGRLSAEIEGGPVDFSRSEVHEEIKAVTYHQLEVKQTGEGWTATVIFDV
jgi:SHS2 domain-containing protein